EGAVFKDDRDLRAGERWPDRLKQEVLARDVLLAVIGDKWLTAADNAGRRRLDDRQDWVRQEVSTALKEGKRVIVLLVGTARVPATPVGGLGGIGKSTFVLTALHDERVVARYEDRRHFVRLDGAPSRSAVAAAVAESVGLPLGDALEDRLLDFLGRGGPRLL